MNKNPSKLVSILIPTFGNIFWIAAFVGVLIHGQRMMNQDGDLGRHLTIGRYILDNGKIPLQDIFSHTMSGLPLTPHEWLAQVGFALAKQIFGFEGVILLCALLIGTTFWLVFKRVRCESQTLTSAILALFLAMVTSMIHWLSRPHLFTFFLLALWMIVLDQLRQGKLKRWWYLPTLMLLWANLHGAFIAGFVTWFLYGLGLGWDAAWQRSENERTLTTHFWYYYLLGGVTSFVATIFNPSGIGLWKTSIGYLGNKYLVDQTVEYMSPNFHETNLWPFLIFIGLITIVMGMNKKKMGAALLFNAIAWLIMGLYSARNIPLFAIVAAPLLSRGVDDLLQQETKRFPLLKQLRDIDIRMQNIDQQLKGLFWPTLTFLIAVIVLGTGLKSGPKSERYYFNPEVFPVRAIDWLEANPQEGEMFNYFIWGGYLLYRQWPAELVFIDGQTDFYGEELSRKYIKVIEVQEGWEDVLEQYHISWAILPSQVTISYAIQSKLGWEVIYEDNTAVILRR